MTSSDSLASSARSSKDYNNSEDSSLNEPIEIHNRFNAKLIRAKWFVQQNKVKLNTENKYFEVMDEKDYVHIVRLLPTQFCSCLEKFKCCHIFAVLHLTGMDIDSSFKHCKMTDLSKLIQKRNGGP